uniref:Uncharacterized protein n=1 Tax=Zea mays TaxID=4577 RepID=C4J0V0_MAIZE|nr:unknown [Zea mays]
MTVSEGRTHLSDNKTTILVWVYKCKRKPCIPFSCWKSNLFHKISELAEGRILPCVNLNFILWFLPSHCKLFILVVTSNPCENPEQQRTGLLAVDWFGAEARHRGRTTVLHRRARPRRPHRHIAHTRHLPSSATRLCEIGRSTHINQRRQGFARSVSGERRIELT